MKKRGQSSQTATYKLNKDKCTYIYIYFIFKKCKINDNIIIIILIFDNEEMHGVLIFKRPKQIFKRNRRH